MLQNLILYYSQDIKTKEKFIKKFVQVFHEYTYDVKLVHYDFFFEIILPSDISKEDLKTLEHISEKYSATIEKMVDGRYRVAI